ncbi:MAG: selenocysteine lyase/cysteine desulfurase [Halieaceae bacterium]|jgi:selenocysteine lyase/cysteine desulfurase
MTMSSTRIREQFPILANKAYFNGCSYGPISLKVKAAIEQYVQIRLDEGARWDIYCNKIESIRELLARLLECPSDDVCVSTSVSESLNSLMTAFNFDGERNKIVSTDFDFPTTAQIMLAQEPRGAKVVRAKADAAGTCIPLSEYERLIDDKTKLVAIPLVCYRNGVWVDIEPIVELAHARGAMVLIDAYQGIGTRPFNVADSGADFLLGGCTKYLIGTSGVAYMYVRGSRTNGLQPTTTGWFAQEDPSAMDIHHHLPHATARRFEAGTPNACGLFAAEAGLELLLDVGLDCVEKQIAVVTDMIKAAVDKHGWNLITPRDRHGAMLAIKSTDAPLLVNRLADRDIILSGRDGNIRIAPHFYNSAEDVDKLAAALLAESELMA